MADYSPPRSSRYSGELHDRPSRVNEYHNSQYAGGPGYNSRPDTYRGPLDRQHYGNYSAPNQYKGPGQYSDYSRTPGQYSEQLRGPGQHTDYSRGPRQYNDYPRGPGQYSEQLRSPGQYSEPLRGPGQYSEPLRGPGQYSEQPRGPGQFSDQPRSPGQYSEQPRGPGQYSEQPRGPGQFSDQPRGAGQFSDQPRGAGQFTDQPRGAGQFTDQPRGAGQFTDQSRGPGVYHGQYSDYSRNTPDTRTLPHSLYSGPVLPSSQRKISDTTRRSQSVKEHKVTDEHSFNNNRMSYPPPTHDNYQSQYGHNDFQTQFKSVPQQGDTGGPVTPKKELFPEHSTHQNNEYQAPVTPATSTSNLSSTSETKSSPISSTPPQLTTPTSEKEELLTEIERQKELKVRLIQEVASLEGQKKLVQEEIEVLKEEEKQLSENVAKLQNEENVLKTRLDQVMQNIDIAEQIEAQEKEGKQNGGHSNQVPPPSSLSDNDRIRELEMTLRERENKIKKREMELEVESDMLYERNKELGLREYDMENDGFRPTSNSLAKERQIQMKQLELDEREQALSSKEQELYQRETEFQAWERRRRDSLDQWHESVTIEDQRALENMRKASELFDKANKLKEEVLGAAEAAELEDKQRVERLNSNTSQGGTDELDEVKKLHIEEENTAASGGRPKGHLTKSVTISPPPTAPPIAAYTSQKSHSVDDQFAYLLKLQLDKEILEEDEKLAEKLRKEEEASKAPAVPVELSEEEEKKQMKRNMGLPEDATDEELEQRIKEFQS